MVAKAREQRERLPELMASARNADGDSPLAQRHELHRMMLEAEQAALHDARAAGAYSSATLAEAQQLLDRGVWREDRHDAH